MNIGAIIAATVLVAAVGLFIGVFLGVAGKKFAVEVDEKEVAVREALPGNNCGMQKYARNTLIRIPPYDSALFLLYVMKIPLSLIHPCDKYTIKLYFII